MAEFLIESDPCSISPSQYRALFTRFIERFEYGQVETILLRSSKGEKDDAPCALQVNIQDLILFDSALAYSLLHYPSLLLPLFNEAAIQVQRDIWVHEDFRAKHQRKLASGGVKVQIQVRLSPLPPVPAFSKASIGDLRAECGGGGGSGLGKGNGLVQILGTIVRTGSVRMLEQSKEYQCQNPQCLYQFTVYADPEQDNMLSQPRSCPRLIMSGRGIAGRGGGGRDPSGRGGRGAIRRCNCPNLREIESSRVCVDYQEIKVQDPMEQLGLGASPRSIAVVLQADLVDQFNPGDKVIIIGSLIRQWRSLARGVRSHIEIVLLANNVVSVYEQETDLLALSVTYAHFRAFWKNFNRLGGKSETSSETSETREDENINLIDSSVEEEEDESSYDLASALSARDFIIRAVCPQLYGMFLVKLSLLLALIGGVEGEYKGGNRRRSEIHMLMVGDPGCGKSQLLRFAASLLPRSVITTGVGTTGAGLTCTAIRESSGRGAGGGGEWSLEAGALVLANGGVCCIDEFSGIKETDRATIHEAMEQQTISIAKAGLVVRLPTRTTVVACCNPKGSFDLSADLTTNTAISSPLLSRFDIILVLLDTPSKDWDKRVSTFLLFKAVCLNTKKEGGDKATRLHLSNSSSSTISSSRHHDREEDEDLRLEREREKEREKERELINSLWNVQTLRQYISVIKAKLKPTLSDEAKLLLMRFYYLQRNNESSSQARTTVRLLEALIRIAEAHAKLMFRRRVLVVDAVMAIYISSFSQMKMISLLSNSGLSNSFLSFERIKDDFTTSSSSSSAYDYYQQIEKEIFIRLNYSLERLQADVRKKNSKKQSDRETLRAGEAEREQERDKERNLTELDEFDSLTSTFLDSTEEWSRGPFPSSRPGSRPPSSQSSSSVSAASFLPPTSSSSSRIPPQEDPPIDSAPEPPQKKAPSLSSYFSDVQPPSFTDTPMRHTREAPRHSHATQPSQSYPPPASQSSSSIRGPPPVPGPPSFPPEPSQTRSVPPPSVSYTRGAEAVRAPSSGPWTSNNVATSSSMPPGLSSLPSLPSLPCSSPVSSSFLPPVSNFPFLSSYSGSSASVCSTGIFASVNTSQSASKADKFFDDVEDEDLINLSYHSSPPPVSAPKSVSAPFPQSQEAGVSSAPHGPPSGLTQPIPAVPPVSQLGSQSIWHSSEILSFMDDLEEE